MIFSRLSSDSQVSYGKGPYSIGTVYLFLLYKNIFIPFFKGVFTIALVRSNLLKSDGIDQSNCLLPVLAPSGFYHWLINFNELFHYDQIVDPFIIQILYDEHDKNSNPSCSLNMKRNVTENWLKLLEQLDINVSKFYPFFVIKC